MLLPVSFLTRASVRMKFVFDLGVGHLRELRMIPCVESELMSAPHYRGDVVRALLDEFSLDEETSS
jgi:hypothetical protein